jgi:hypothetical protein
MITVDRLEAALLRLPPRDRERMALTAWESLDRAETWLSNPGTDPEGIASAFGRDAEIESGSVTPLSHEEFLWRIFEQAPPLQLLAPPERSLLCCYPILLRASALSC